MKQGGEYTPEELNGVLASLDAARECMCSDEYCGALLDDGEGYDGLCGVHADAAEAEGGFAKPCRPTPCT